MFCSCSIGLKFTHCYGHVFRRASSDPVKWWLQQLTKNGVPVLVCLTYADVLYLECKEADRQEDIASELEVNIFKIHLQSEFTLYHVIYSAPSKSPKD